MRLSSTPPQPAHHHINHSDRQPHIHLFLFLLFLPRTYSGPVQALPLLRRPAHAPAHCAPHPLPDLLVRAVCRHRGLRLVLPRAGSDARWTAEALQHPPHANQPGRRARDLPRLRAPGAALHRRRAAQRLGKHPFLSVPYFTHTRARGGEEAPCVASHAHSRLCSCLCLRAPFFFFLKMCKLPRF